MSNLVTQDQITIWNTLKATYLIFGKEHGSITETFHLQGYVEVSSKTSLSTMKKFLGRAHWEKARGSAKDASAYCMKEGDYQEWGTISPGQGTRTDLEEIRSLISKGASDKEIADQYFSQWIYHRKSFQEYRLLSSEPRDFETITHVYWGKTGTGKTRFVLDQIMDSSYWMPGDYHWFDGYTGQDIVILDDYRGEYKLQLLLKLLDRYPMSVPIKGGFTNWRPRKVYITSNIHPHSWYPREDAYSIAAMFRRLHLIESVFFNLYE